MLKLLLCAIENRRTIELLFSLLYKYFKQYEFYDCFSISLPLRQSFCTISTIFWHTSTIENK